MEPNTRRILVALTSVRLLDRVVLVPSYAMAERIARVIILCHLTHSMAHLVRLPEMFHMPGQTDASPAEIARDIVLSLPEETDEDVAIDWGWMRE